VVLADGTVVGGPVRLGVGLVGDGGQGDRVDARRKEKIAKKTPHLGWVSKNHLLKNFKKPPVFIRNTNCIF
jgi:hypothetical protein